MWHDGLLLSFALLFCTFVYAYCRYSEHLNGKYRDHMVPMYILDKAVCWTALWMMVVSPLAGNLLALRAMFLDSERLASFTLYCE